VHAAAAATAGTLACVQVCPGAAAATWQLVQFHLELCAGQPTHRQQLGKDGPGADQVSPWATL
jgi:hypothetical protein